MSDPEKRHESIPNFLSLRHYPLVSEMSQEQLKEYMAHLKALAEKAAAENKGSDKRFWTYSIVVDLSSDARSFVYGVDPELTAMVGEEAAVKEFNRFVKGRFSKDVWAIRLVRFLETPNEECIAVMRRTNSGGFVPDSPHEY